MISHTSETIKGATFIHITITINDEVVASARCVQYFRSPTIRLNELFIKEENKEVLWEKIFTYIKTHFASEIITQNIKI